MHKEIKRFVRFWSPGSFVAEDWVEGIDSLDPGKVVWPDRAYCFSLHEREDVVDGEKRFVGESKQVGPLYYHPDSKVESLAEVKRNPRASSTLVSNMECNHWAHVIWSRWINWPQPFDKTKACILVKDGKQAAD